MLWKHYEDCEDFKIPVNSSNFMGCLPMKVNLTNEIPMKRCHKKGMH